MKKSLSQKLADNLDYFVSNPKRRCFLGVYGCKYHGETLGIKTKGCFIGALLPVATRRMLDENKVTNIFNVIEYCKENNIKLPKMITDNRNLMSYFQLLHDANHFWNENGLSNEGISELNFIINEYNLDREPFEKFLN